MPLSMMYGVLCQILWLSSLAFEQQNDLSVALSTPVEVAPHGVAFCFTDRSYSQKLQSVSVVSLQASDSLFAAAWREVVSVPAQQQPATSWRSNSFFGSTGLQEPVEGGTAKALLSSDKHFDSSFQVEKFDDLTQDQSQQPLPADMFQGPAVTSNITRTSRYQPVWQSSKAGECMIISGDWQANTAYMLTLRITNPKPPSTLSAQTTKTPELWMVPLTYKQLQDTRQGASTGVQLIVRGSKQGTLCRLRPKAAAGLSKVFSACDEAQRHGLSPASSSTADCMSALHSALDSNVTAWSQQFPFNVPPLVNPASLNGSSNPDTTCEAGQALSPRFGGECVDCGNGAPDATNTSCNCYPGYSTNLLGPTACGPAISSTWNVSSGSELAQQLCVQYSRFLELVQQGMLGDRLVQTMYPDAFRQQAAYLLDQAAVDEAAEYFRKTYVPDERMPASPTRRGRGIGPDCKSCRNGLFKDIYSKQWVAPRDDRFLAVNTLRLIGYILDSIGSPCKALWDPADPMKWMYGRYDKTMCVG